jgi:general secretion pathway protein C
MPQKWTIGLANFAVWALAAFAAVFWATKVLQPPTSGSLVPVATVAAASADPVPMVRVLGKTTTVTPPAATQQAAAIDPASRFSLVGVVAGRGNTGVALLSVDGKPPRPYRVGANIDDSHVLRAVDKRSATLSRGASAPGFSIELPSQNATAARPAMPVSAAFSKASN